MNSTEGKALLNTAAMMVAAKASPQTVFYNKESPVACMYLPADLPITPWNTAAFRTWDVISGTDCPMPDSDQWEQES